MIDELKRLLDASSRTVIFTGAGISTESGIPDFRSPGGIWTKMQPIDFSDFMASKDVRRESWRRKIASDGTISKAEPNRGHRAVAALVKRGTCSAIITQNVDDLHQRSGVPRDQVIELHGNTTFAKCLKCGERYELQEIYEEFKKNEEPPVCSKCGGIVKGATISFGQAMPEAEMARAQSETLASDLFIAIGSSLVVFPAAGFPIMAKENGAKLVILTRDPTDMDSIADLVLNLEIGPTLGEAVGVE